MKKLALAALGLLLTTPAFAATVQFDVTIKQPHIVAIDYSSVRDILEIKIENHEPRMDEIGADGLKVLCDAGEADVKIDGDPGFVATFSVKSVPNHVVLLDGEGAATDVRAEYTCPDPEPETALAQYVYEHWQDREHDNAFDQADRLGMVTEINEGNLKIIGPERLRGYFGNYDRADIKDLQDAGNGSFMAYEFTSKDGLIRYWVVPKSRCLNICLPEEMGKLLHQHKAVKQKSEKPQKKPIHANPSTTVAPEPRNSESDPYRVRCTKCN